MNSEQKPPIDITGSKGKSGPLDPEEDRQKLIEQRYGGKPKGSGGGTNWMPAIVAIVVSVIVTTVMVFVFNPTQTGLNTLSDQVVELNNRTVTLESQSAETNSRLEQFLSNSASYVTQSALTGITDGMASETEVSTLQSLIVSLTTENGALADRIDVLEVVKEEEEEEEASGVPTEAQVWIDLDWSDRFTWSDDDGDANADPLEEGADGIWVCTKSLSFTIVNESDKDIKDVEVELVIHSKGTTMDFDTSANAVEVDGGYPFNWQVAHVESSVIVLRGTTPSWGDGLEIEADDDEGIFFTITLPRTEVDGNETLYIEAEVTDFKIMEEDD